LVLITALDLAHVHAAHAPGFLRSVLVTVLDLAHVYAAPSSLSFLLLVCWGGASAAFFPALCLVSLSQSRMLLNLPATGVNFLNSRTAFGNSQVSLHQLPSTQSPRLLNKLNVSPRDTQAPACVMCVGPRTNFASLIVKGRLFIKEYIKNENRSALRITSRFGFAGGA